MTGSSDADLWRRIQEEGRWLVTADKGFADVRLYPPGSHAGVLLLRADEEGLDQYLQLAGIAVARLCFDNISGAVVVVTSQGARVRGAS